MIILHNDRAYFPIPDRIHVWYYLFSTVPLGYIDVSIFSQKSNMWNQCFATSKRKHKSQCVSPSIVKSTFIALYKHNYSPIVKLQSCVCFQNATYHAGNGSKLIFALQNVTSGFYICATRTKTRDSFTNSLQNSWWWGR